MYSNYVIAEVECRRVDATPTVGQHRLLFRLEFTLNKWEGGQVDGYLPYLADLRAEVQLDGSSVGIALPIEEDFLSPIGPAGPGTVVLSRTFAVDVDQHALEDIEQKRKSLDAAFVLDVLGTATIYSSQASDAFWDQGGGTFHPLSRIEPIFFEPRLAKTRIHYRLPRSDWVELLDRMGYARNLLYEIPWPESADGRLEEAISRFEGARASFLSGHHSEAVGKLRDSLESVRNELGIPALDWNKSRRNMTLDERFVFAWDAVRHLTHPAHHGGSYSREEAHYILGMGALTLSLAAGFPGALKRAEEQGTEEDNK